MNPFCFRVLLFAGLLFFCPIAFAQYILNGSAQKISCNCYTLTDERTFQSGSVWNSNKIDLRQSFDFSFNVFLGCKDGDGADGIVFILQPISTSIGSSGEGMGFGGVRPSIGIALDTWQNFNLDDPSYDHISIQANGTIHHSTDLAGPVSASETSGNIEDCNWHVLRIQWDASTNTLTAFFDGSRRVQKQVDLVGTIFNNDPAVFWGFTGATGGSVNLQRFCTALNPVFSVNGNTNGGCVDKPVQFTDASVSFAPVTGYHWSFGDGTFSNEKNPPAHTYPAPGRYPVNLKIKGQDGCEKDSTLTVTIGSAPVRGLQVYDTCAGLAPRYGLADSGVGMSYQWRLNGALVSTMKQPNLPLLPEGKHELEVLVTSPFNCGPPALSTASFTVKPRPVVEAAVEDGCVDEVMFFRGISVNSTPAIARWNWNLGDGTSAASPAVSHAYRAAGQYGVNLWALGTNGCVSDTAFAVVKVNAALADAGRDTAVIKGVPFQLQGTGNGDFRWSPATGLSNPAIANPVVTLDDDRQFVLTVTTAEGCTAADTVAVKTFKGPAIYVPTAVTPNGDGKNDLLKPTYVGILDLKQFTVYNRWGGVVFSTRDRGRGWDARAAPAATYVWLVEAVDATGRPMVLKGTVIVIR